jgi:hypothetical protein
MKNLHFVFIAALVALLVQPASAQRRPQGNQQPTSPVLAALDKNGDGEISAAELKDAAKALKSLDKNRDGQITADEVRPQFGRPSGSGGRRWSTGGTQRWQRESWSAANRIATS